MALFVTVATSVGADDVKNKNSIEQEPLTAVTVCDAARAFIRRATK